MECAAEPLKVKTLCDYSATIKPASKGHKKTCNPASGCTLLNYLVKINFVFCFIDIFFHIVQVNI